MGKNTNLNTGAPKHNKLTCKIIESDDFINLHLFYELRMLLGAAKMIKPSQTKTLKLRFTEFLDM